MRNLAYGIVLSSCWLTSWVVSSLAVNDIVSSNSVHTKTITVKKAEFGVLRDDSNSKMSFVPTTKVPFQEGKRYGWRIQLNEHKREVTWKEILRLPKLPETWSTSSGENFVISTDGMEAVTKRTQSAKKGVIENFWTVASGDPTGKHTIAVYIDNRRVGFFEFEIISPKKK
ncbi:MAG: hypothetical protein HC862_14780 [Scytonema sp. RU_4_4]|nr:hypothetical protein [Scytonema sp. RU_4_4]NJR74142.1 hypothetical protein [Scytonema sp. CRU_2_7]